MNSFNSIDIFWLDRILLNISPSFPSTVIGVAQLINKVRLSAQFLGLQTSTTTFSLMAKLLTRKISWQWKRSPCSAVLVFTTLRHTRTPASWWPSREWPWTVCPTTPRPRTTTPPGWRGSPFLKLRSSIFTGFSQYPRCFDEKYSLLSLAINSMTPSTMTARL